MLYDAKIPIVCFRSARDQGRDSFAAGVETTLILSLPKGAQAGNGMRS